MTKVLTAEMSWREVEEAIKRGAAAIFPIASTEQHGPHCPTGDFLVTDAIAQRVAAVTHDVVFPCVPFGYSEYFRKYPGTITLRTDTLFRVLEDAINCMIDHGFERIVIFNGHAGNRSTVGQLLRKIRRHRGLLVASVAPLAMADPHFVREIFNGSVPGHGGASMASYMMHIRPGTVDLDLTEDWETREFLGLPSIGLNGVSFEGREASFAIDMDDITPPSGSLTDPSLASAERGRLVIDHVVERLVRFMAWFSGVNPRT